MRIYKFLNISSRYCIITVAFYKGAFYHEIFRRSKKLILTLIDAYWHLSTTNIRTSYTQWQKKRYKETFFWSWFYGDEDVFVQE